MISIRLAERKDRQLVNQSMGYLNPQTSHL